MFHGGENLNKGNAILKNHLSGKAQDRVSKKRPLGSSSSIFPRALRTQLARVCEKTRTRDLGWRSALSKKKTGVIDCNDRIDKSLFRLCLDWIRYALKRNLDVEPIFRFQAVLSVMYGREFLINGYLFEACFAVSPCVR